MFQILFDHFIGDIASRPCAVSDCPKMIAPVSLFQIRKFRLKQSRGATFKSFYQIRKRKFRRIFDVHMNVVFAYHARQYSHIFRVANLREQITATNFYIAFKHVIAIFCCPNQMDGQSRNCVMSVPVLFHLPQFSHEILAEAN